MAEKVKTLPDDVVYNKNLSKLYSPQSAIALSHVVRGINSNIENDVQEFYKYKRWWYKCTRAELVCLTGYAMSSVTAALLVLRRDGILIADQLEADSKAYYHAIGPKYDSLVRAMERI